MTKTLKYPLTAALTGRKRSGENNSASKEEKMDKDRILALDTETTGVGPNAEILQLSVIDGEGAVRMNQYFRPKKNSSWPEAEKVNHISPAMVSKCPFILDHKEEIQEMLGNAETIVGYNLPFDVQMLLQSGLTLPDPKKTIYIDIMPPFSEKYGERDPFTGDIRWQKLITCAKHYGYDGEGWHDSLADTKATIYCFWKMIEDGTLKLDKKAEERSVKIALGNTRQKKKYYVVKRGRNPGVYYTWDDCKKEVQGFNGAVYKGFVTKEDAEAWYGKPVKEAPKIVKPAGTAASSGAPAAAKSSAKGAKDIAEAEKTFPAKAKKLGPALKAGFRVPDTLTIYTDGSCLSNPDGPGGFAAVFLTEEGEAFLHLTGGEPGTTNNRMELRAAYEALKWISQDGKRRQITFCTDSKYLQRAITQRWLNNWKRNGWITTKGTPVLNQDLWKGIDAFLTSHALSFEWTKGHAGAQYNELCDQLAKAEASRFQ